MRENQTEFCNFVGSGLGPYSKQACESLHSEFKKCWGNFSDKDTTNDKYPEKFLPAVQILKPLSSYTILTAHPYHILSISSEKRERKVIRICFLAKFIRVTLYYHDQLNSDSDIPSMA